MKIRKGTLIKCSRSWASFAQDGIIEVFDAKTDIHGEIMLKAKYIKLKDMSHHRLGTSVDGGGWFYLNTRDEIIQNKINPNFSGYIQAEKEITKKDRLKKSNSSELNNCSVKLLDEIFKKFKEKLIFSRVLIIPI